MLDNPKPGTRLLAAFLTVAIVGAIVAAAGIVHKADMIGQAGRTDDQTLARRSHAKQAHIHLIHIGRAGALLAATPEQVRRLSGQLDKARPRYTLEIGKKLRAEVDRGLAGYAARLPDLLKQALAFTPEGKAAAAELAPGPLAAKANSVDDQLSALARPNEKKSAVMAAPSSRHGQGSQALTLALALGSLGAGVGLGLWITRGLTRQLGAEPACPVQVGGAMAAGELPSVIRPRPGDNDSLLHAMETMRAALERIAAQVRSGTGTVAAASGQGAAGSLGQSARTGQQASAPEPAASSMEELTGSVMRNADNMRETDVPAASAAEVAGRGGSVAHTLASINDSSRTIADIIGVIDGIAFQTNILALNATVEAAEAGEQGRGFAMVASEVRNLAQRSAAAAREIKTLIDDSVGQLDACGKLVDHAGVTMADIVESITRVTGLMSGIAPAGVEQSAGIEQVNMAISQMHEVTRQNAALVEQAAAAAGSMQEQAAHLAHVVSIFKLGNEQAARAAVPLPQAAARAAAMRPPTVALAAGAAPEGET
ncbi:methyl-accepting chemotaxis protein [Massilia violaceinigra]|uniref:Methyl-accepting chemotaxis protein n=1 Tax=Massilia violaceinigra TaxID=2045208 RepID=A0A2D2DSR1_9BURK|nr:methyl-accepting chemotaxis protein [Massilia violaceinigra]ATQ78019.1 methyl-accepting chemotaxis protein [Massilia violaceinigra]